MNRISVVDNFDKISLILQATVWEKPEKMNLSMAAELLHSLL
jgi:hypothetical protein